jgi:hypothetical protein
MEKLVVVFPQQAQGDLVELTRQICLKTGQETGFGLGGQYGYGVEFENETFMMHPYCWCDGEDCPWCSKNAPNFLYKPTGYKLRWYKWIGRGEESEGELPNDWFAKCVESIWEKDDCWYEFDAGREKTLTVSLCFNVSDPKATVTAELSPFAEGAVECWDLETIIADIANARLEETEQYKQAVRLNKKYPALGKRIAKDALKHHLEQIQWHRRWISQLKEQV